MSSTSKGSDNSGGAPTSSATKDPSTLSFVIAAIVLGSSAGMTLYTRKSGAMLSRMKQVTDNEMRRNPPKFGPPTKAEWEKLRPRHFDD
mmetsp:Transcript_7208/g.9362  ORF Transcript_7208/g.9362 Transcript_7208/m.9362 type:complete len:89 (-) Transcript_7208:385-651(-)